MNKQQFAIVLLNIAATLTSDQPHERRVILASNQVKNALTRLEQSAVMFNDNAPHRKCQDGRDMDSDLADLRSGKVPLIVRLTETQLAEIEAERWGK